MPSGAKGNAQPQARTGKKPHWLSDAEWQALQTTNRSERLHVRKALQFSLLGASQDSESKRVTLDVARVLVQMAGSPSAEDPAWAWLMAEVGRYERAVGDEALPDWWSPGDFHRTRSDPGRVGRGDGGAEHPHAVDDAQGTPRRDGRRGPSSDRGASYNQRGLERPPDVLPASPAATQRRRRK
jgi:hypothetical protein